MPPQDWAAAGQHWHQVGFVGPIGLLLPLAQLLFPLLFILLVSMLWRGANAASRRVHQHTRASRPLPTPSVIEPPLRASDRERDETAQMLSHAVGEGRLSLDEGRERIGAALSARYSHELKALLADLPRTALPAVTRERSRTARPRRAGLFAAAAFAGVGLVLVLVGAALWLLWPLGIAAIAVVAFSRR